MSALLSLNSMEVTLPNPGDPAIPTLASPAQMDSPAENGEGKQGWLLSALRPKHHQLCALLAQGVPRQTIAAVLDWTPEYITMLARQPLIKQEIRNICEVAGLSAEAQFEKVVSVIGETLENGSEKGRLQAARLNLELTGRVGPRVNSVADQIDSSARLDRLAERLEGLVRRAEEKTIPTRRDSNGTYEASDSGE